MSESHLDEFDHYNIEQDKYVNNSHSGKNRSKREVAEHSNHHDPSGHTRKILTKLQNTEAHNKEGAKNKH